MYRCGIWAVISRINILNIFWKILLKSVCGNSSPIDSSLQPFKVGKWLWKILVHSSYELEPSRMEPTATVYESRWSGEIKDPGSWFGINCKKNPDPGLPSRGAALGTTYSHSVNSRYKATPRDREKGGLISVVALYRGFFKILTKNV